MIELVADALLGGKHAFCKTLVVNKLARLVYNILCRTGLALGIVHFDSCNIGLPSHPPSQMVIPVSTLVDAFALESSQPELRHRFCIASLVILNPDSRNWCPLTCRI